MLLNMRLRESQSHVAFSIWEDNSVLKFVHAEEFKRHISAVDPLV